MKIRDIIICALFCTLICICSVITVPLPFSPVPISLSLIAIFLCGALQSLKYGLFSICGYILLGVAGIPVFSGFNSGFGVLVGPTGGYLLSYVLMILCIYLIIKVFHKRTFFAYLISMLSSIIICHAFGSIWLAYFLKTDIISALLVGSIPYIIPDIIKAVLGAYLAQALYKRLFEVNNV